MILVVVADCAAACRAIQANSTVVVDRDIFAVNRSRIDKAWQ